MTPTRSAIESASDWSWVTNRVVIPSRCCRLRISARSWVRTLRVERRERLVEQQHRRLDRQRAGDRDALLLAAGELVRVAVGGLREAHQLQQLVGALEARRLVLAAHAQAEGDVGAHVHVREQAVCLKDHAHVALVRRACW